MSPQRKAAMTPAAFRKLLEDAGLSYTHAAGLLDVNRRTVIRWATGETPIDKRNAAYLRSVLSPKK